MAYPYPDSHQLDSFHAVAMSASGQYMYVTDFLGMLKNTATRILSRMQFFGAVAVSASGQNYQYKPATSYDGNYYNFIFQTANYGNTWTSPPGQTLIIGTYNSTIYQYYASVPVPNTYPTYAANCSAKCLAANYPNDKSLEFIHCTSGWLDWHWNGFKWSKSHSSKHMEWMEERQHLDNRVFDLHLFGLGQKVEFNRIVAAYGRNLLMSGTAQYMYILSTTNSYYRSVDYGLTWFPGATAMSDSGQVILVSADSPTIYSGSDCWWSLDYGITWTSVAFPAVYQQTYNSVSLDSSGQYATIINALGEIYQTSDFGTTWSQPYIMTLPAYRAFGSVTSSDGRTMATFDNSVGIYLYQPAPFEPSEAPTDAPSTHP
eukprot:gene23691-29936_t